MAFHPYQIGTEIWIGLQIEQDEGTHGGLRKPHHEIRDIEISTGQH
jgi:hypothetical protein